MKVYIKYLKQAYDITDSNKLLEITNWNTYNINKTVISNNGRTKAPVKILIIYLTDHFEVKSGLKHWEGLAHLLLNTASDYAIRRLIVDVNLSLIYKSGQIAGYADGTDIKGNPFRQLKRQTESYRNTQKIRLTINTTATKGMVPWRRDSNRQQIEIQNTEAAGRFTYLGTKLTRDKTGNVRIP